MSITETAKKKTTTTKAACKKACKKPVKKISYVSIEPATNGIIIEVTRNEMDDYENEKIVCATTDAALTCLENIITEIRSQ